MTELADFLGRWRCTYWFPSNTFVGEEPSQYTMVARQEGDELVLESEPNAEKSHLLVRLTLHDDIASGTWHEITSPTGEFKGALYDGSGQLVIDAKTHFMEGKWAGAGFDRKLQKKRIYSGNWEIVPITDN